MLTQVPES